MISIEDFLFYAEDALGAMVGIVTGLGDDLANRRPDVPGANSPFAILTHCLGVMEFWGGTAVAGRTVERDRAAEFVATGTVDSLAERAEATRLQLRRDVEGVDPGAPPRVAPRDDDVGLPFGTSIGGVLIHIYEELAQHRGQMEVTRDVLRAPWARFVGDS
jgi:Protein of unknown function (DUF664)